VRAYRSIAFAAAAVAAALFARGGAQPSGPQSEPEGGRKIVHLKADNTGPVAPGDSVVFLVGNFAAQHNGAVITADSAVRYSDMRLECFGNVLINKNTTYIYGDRAEYDGERNEARIYSDLIKVVDGDATLYTYSFSFDTKENVGTFDGGGVMSNRDNLVEAVRGYYYSDAKELICVERVEMRNDEYELKGDSVVYNLETDHAYFFTNTNIWNRDGDYLYADRGEYRKADSLYVVTRNGYVLTAKQELWSDSIDYSRVRNHAVLRSGIQFDDAEHKAMAFGDYGEYWKEPGDLFLTRRPAVVSYDPSQGDSLFVRADSMFLFTIVPGAEPEAADSLAAEPHSEQAADVPDSTGGGRRGSRARRGGAAAGREEGSGGAEGSGGTADADASVAADSAAVVQPDSAVGVRIDPLDTLTGDARKSYLKEQARRTKEKKRAEAAKARKERLATIASARKARAAAKLQAQQERDRAKEEARLKRAQERLRARAKRRGEALSAADSAARRRVDSLLSLDSAARDSAMLRAADSLRTDSLRLDSLRTDSLRADSAAGADSTYRLLKGFRNVKIYRSDFQAVCDSMTGISTDSTFHLYIDPVLWNQNNQITSEVMDVFTKNRQIVRADFVGAPMMVSELDTAHYNQIAGKRMTAWFRDNAIYRDDVNGNVQTIYYIQDGEPPRITGMAVIESGDASFYIEDKQIVFIVYRINPEWPIYPIDQIPADQERFLKGFEWKGARRPLQAEVFDRRIRPSQRAEKERLRHPEFPILQRMEERKKRWIEYRRWYERNETVDPATVEWMRDLGYEPGQPRESGPKF